MRKTLKNILNEYGPIAVVVYLSLFAVVLFGAYFAIRLGWTPADAASQVGAWTAAYIVTKLTQPLRIAGTVLITTLIGKTLEKRKSVPD
ncbi:MAG: hypothetical protein ABIS03_10070 [Gemmatimonadaceae bacterium]